MRKPRQTVELLHVSSYFGEYNVIITNRLQSSQQLNFFEHPQILTGRLDSFRSEKQKYIIIILYKDQYTRTD